MQWVTLITITSLAVLFETLARHVALAGTGVPYLRGVAHSKKSLYKPERDFQCLDGSLVISFVKVNDDYCDCRDGSDEPGTAACANGSFYCQNKGHKGLYIPSSWVNDGVCDCCDASDEYASEAQCVDNCHELGREAWLQAQKAAELINEGNKLRLEYIKQGKQLKTENQAKLVKLRTDYEEAELTKKEKEVIKQRAEEREAAAIEKFKPPESEKSIDQDAQEEEKEIAEYEAEEYFRILDSDSSGTVTIAELQTRTTFDKDRNGEISREEALYFLSNQEELTLQEFIDSAWINVKPFLMLEKGIFKPAEKEDEGMSTNEPEPYQETHISLDDEIDEDEAEYEQNEAHAGEVEDSTTEQPPEPEKPAVQYDEETQAVVNEAQEARQNFQEAERAVLDIQNEIRKLEDRVEQDYGPEEEFAPLHGKCFEYADYEYIYTLCPFNKVTQRSRNGGNEVNLGHWNSWIGDGNKYTKAKFDRGLTCWNGPSRSTIVTVKCGAVEGLLAVTEPNRCEYAMEFSTPALCNPNNENADVHDEL